MVPFGLSEFGKKGQKFGCDCKASSIQPDHHRASCSYLVVSQNKGYLFGGPYNKDYSILGSILGYLNFGKLPFVVSQYVLSSGFPH